MQNKKTNRKKNKERCGERRIKKDGGEGVSAIFDFDVQHIQTLFEKYWWPLKGPLLYRVNVSLSTFSTDSASQLDVFGHDGDSLSVDGTQISIFKQTHQVRFACLLQRADGGTLEPQVGLEILGDLPHQPLERQFPDQKLGGFLVTTDFSKRNSPGPVAMRFFHPAGRGGAFPGRFGGQLLAGRFPTR